MEFFSPINEFCAANNRITTESKWTSDGEKRRRGMGIRAGEELLESLRDDRALFIDGERVKDVTADPRFAGAARSLANLYDMQHDPALVERMTFRSTTSGERFGISFIEPRSVDDLIRRRDMVKIWMDASCGMFGRSPDFMNISARTTSA